MKSLRTILTENHDIEEKQSSHFDESKKDYSEACKQAFIASSSLIIGGSTWGKHVSFDQSGLPEATRDDTIVSYKKVMSVNQEPQNIDPDTIVIMQKDKQLTAYWLENKKIASKSFPISKTKDIATLLPEPDKKSDDPKLINIIIEKYSCDDLRKELRQRDEKRFEGFHRGILSVRKKMKEEFAIEADPILAEIEARVSTAKKYSLGNCGEFACVAFNYCLIHNIPAEIYEVASAGPNFPDHNFVIIGRNPDSNPNDSKTWGENAWVCDPWDNKFYHATEFIKNFTLLYGSEFLVRPRPLYNTSHLHKERTIEKLKSSFLKRCNLMKIPLEKQKNNFEYLLKQVKSEKSKFIISNKLNKINRIITTLSQSDKIFEGANQEVEKKAKEQKNKNKSQDTYALVREELLQAMTWLHTQSKAAIDISNEEKHSLFKPGFFGLSSRSKKIFEEIGEESLISELDKSIIRKLGG